MKINDVNGNQKNATALKVVEHSNADITASGIAEIVEYIEAEILGKSGRVWVEYYPAALFRTMNPGVSI